MIVHRLAGLDGRSTSTASTRSATSAAGRSPAGSSPTRCTAGPTCRRPTTPRTRASRAASASPSSGTSRRSGSSTTSRPTSSASSTSGSAAASCTRSSCTARWSGSTAASTPTCRTRSTSPASRARRRRTRRRHARVRDAGMAGGAARHAALPRRRPHHGVRLAPLPHARALRRGVRGPLPLQPPAARRCIRTSGATRGSCTSGPASRHRRDGADQAPLLHDARLARAQPDHPDRAGAGLRTRRTGRWPAVLNGKRRRDEPPEEPSGPSLESSGPSGRRASHLGGLALCGSCSASGRTYMRRPRGAQGRPRAQPATWAESARDQASRACARRTWRPCRARAARSGRCRPPRPRTGGAGRPGSSRRCPPRRPCACFQRR